MPGKKDGETYTRWFALLKMIQNDLSKLIPRFFFLFVANGNWLATYAVLKACFSDTSHNLQPEYVS